MTFVDRLRALVEVGDPAGTVTIAWIAAQLDADRILEVQENAIDSIDLTVSEVAALFHRGNSTVRTWIANGVFPNAYRLHGREWRVPYEDLTAMQKREARTRNGRKSGVANDSPSASDLGSWRHHAGGTG